MMTKDNQQRFYLTLGSNRGMSIRDEMDNFFEDNKAFAIFQVCEANDLIVTNLSLHLCISDLLYIHRIWWGCPVFPHCQHNISTW